jgi:hypothetical protein
MKKIYLFAIIPFVLGIVCWIAYNVIGSYVAPDGTLIEPFGFIPTGFLLIAVSAIAAVATSAWALFHNPQKSDKWIFGLSIGFVVLVSLYLAIASSYLSQKAHDEILNNDTSSKALQNGI